ncbi:hypothetical protein [Halomicrobium salinisoli]|uniref:hypothetical protein n=1 Tax=Halomicrobium salinisoli TaxID=2878391 RepID=UPI001CF06219|nr:hypothetical protein [Halomicrobium salinisoli]
MTLIVGIFLLFTPLYWDTLLNIGVSPVLDPAAAIGAAPGGGYPAAVGAATLAVGGAVVWHGESDTQPTTIVLTGGIGGAVIGILATTVLVSVPLFLATQIGLAGAAPGFAAVRGAATERTSHRLGTGLVVLSLAPLLGAHITRGATVGGLAGFASFLLAGTLIVYTAILSYPFYRLGRIIR